MNKFTLTFITALGLATFLSSFMDHESASFLGFTTGAIVFVYAGALLMDSFIKKSIDFEALWREIQPKARNLSKYELAREIYRSNCSCP